MSSRQNRLGNLGFYYLWNFTCISYVGGLDRG